MIVVRYHTADSVEHAALLLAEGRKYLQVMTLDSSGIRIRKVLKGEAEHMQYVPRNVAKVAKHYRAAGKRFGITDSAKRALRGAA